MAQKDYDLWQVADVALRGSMRAIEEVRSLARQPGPQGEPGKDGASGKLDAVKDWAEGITYRGEVRSYNGSTYQARRDTAREPPHEDWQPLALRGQDGRGFVVRGTWSPAETYARHDIVARNASSFVALKDNPGECPGDDWKLWAGQGKTGKPGEPGPRGLQGPPGVAPRQVGWREDLEGFRAFPLYSDGSEGPPLPLGGFIERALARYHAEAQ